ncbi:MAG TPA: class I SAM-dependent methyltransferase [Candidatus Saccharimonadales bacterium]|nr:class I SAM-dependent methyltransferase [Candidatus Saccharimonadales bacterium]
MVIVLWILGLIVLIFGVVVFRGAPYVPSRRKDVRRAFEELYPLSQQDVVVDIGSGDGVVLREAAMHGARAVGYELNPILVVISRLLSRSYKNRISIHLADFWHRTLPDDMTAVYTFGESRDIERMAKKVGEEATRLGRPIYFISYAFKLRDRAPEKEVGAHVLYKLEPLQVS